MENIQPKHRCRSMALWKGEWGGFSKVRKKLAGPPSEQTPSPPSLKTSGRFGDSGFTSIAEEPHSAALCDPGQQEPALNETVSTGLGIWSLGPQLPALFGEVKELLRGRILLEKSHTRDIL